MSKPRLCWWYACAVLYLWFFAHFALHAWKHPVENWDMIAYMGVVESYSDSDPQQIYDHTMARVRSVVSDSRYYGVTVGNRLSASADAFFQQLPLYKVKPLYPGAMFLLDKLGMPMHVASYALSILGFLATGILCFFMIPRGMDAGIWWLAVLWFCTIGHWPYRNLAAWSTPDTLYTFFFLAAFGMWTYRKSAAGLGVFLLLAQLARPDMILLTPFLLAFFALDGSAPRLPAKAVLLIFAANAAAYLLVTQLAGHYGYLVQFAYTFIYKDAHPAGIVPDVNTAQFLAIVADGARHVLHDARVQKLAALSLLALFCRWRYRAGEAWFAHLIGVAWLAYAARFCLYPAWWEDRYYFPYYFMLLYASVEILGPCALAVRRSLAAVDGEG